MSNINIYNDTPLEELSDKLRTDTVNGLDWLECENRLKSFGYNEFKPDESPRVFRRYLEQFQNPLIQLLLTSVIISLLMGQYDDAISIAVAVLIVITVAFIQEYRSEKSLKELTKLVPPTCRAIRNGKHEEFLARYLVPGDVVLISIGDRVPADIRIVESCNLTIDESNLTGETESAFKTPYNHKPTGSVHNQYSHENGDLNSNFINIPANHDVIPNDNSCHAYMGTLVQSGHGKGLVVGTGDKTQFGSVFKMMQSEQAPKSPLQQNMDQLGGHLSIYSMCIITIIVIIGWLQSRSVVEMFTIGVALAVSAIPEGLPIVVTVTLALGVMRMARRKAIVRHLPAVETLGCVHIICTDKTGTLTKNEMTLTHISTSEAYLADVTGTGYYEMGEVVLRDLSKEQHVQMESIRRLITAAYLCNNAKFDSSGCLIGQATEGAILVAARKLGIEDIKEQFERIDEVPFDSNHKYMSVRCIDREKRGSPSYYVKGALETVLAMCTHYSKHDTRLGLLESHKQDILHQSELIESRGLRVLAVAYGENMTDLTYLGLVGILDPPRPGVEECLKVLSESGIRIKMITGDSKITAQSIARDLGLMGPSSCAMSGKELDILITDDRLSWVQKAERLENVSLFYRVTPQHKVAIVKLYQSLNYIIAMTGDGVNDGVALKKADIGISMGSGTDVCKEAADVILMDDNLQTILVAIEEGKGIYYNIRNFIKFQLSTSIAALSMIALSTIFHIPNPLNAMQILYINILMDGPPAQTLGVEQVDQDVLKQLPRDVKEPVLTKDLLMSVFTSAAIIVIGTMSVFMNEVGDGLVDEAVSPRATTVTFTCFVFFSLFNALSCRSQTKSILEIGFFTNKAFLLAAGGSIIGQLLVIYCKPIQKIFQTETLSLLDIIYLLAVSSTVFLVSEFYKLCKNHKRRRFIKASYMYLV